MRFGYILKITATVAPEIPGISSAIPMQNPAIEYLS
jgi:hypothetical protein